MKFGLRVLMGSVFAAALSASTANAGTIPYPNAGTVNSATYNFTANGGDVTAYFAGASAGYTEVVGLLVNGVDTGIYGLNNQTSNLGDSLDFGVQAAGAQLTFVDKIIAGSSDIWYSYSSPIANSDGIQHAYSTSYASGQIPGLNVNDTYVAFEDLPLGQADLDYNDVQFVFTNVAGAPGPVPGTGVLGLALLALYGAFRLRRA